jgi:hypothetical protein
MTYGIIFVGNSSDSSKVFLLHNKVNRNMTDAQERKSCGEMFKNFHKLPLAGGYLLALIALINDNTEMFQKIRVLSCKQQYTQA